MAVSVMLMVFSGRENPSWNLSADQIGTLRDKLASLRGTTMERPEGMLGGLGYQGFSITASQEMDLEPNIFIHSNIVDLGPSSVALRDSGNNLEAWLLDSGRDAVEPKVRSYVQSQFEAPAYAGPSARRTKSRGLEVPRYEPNIWNNDAGICWGNNCYNYANNKITNTFAQPGLASGITLPRPLDGQSVARGAIADGLEALANSEAWQSTPADGHWIALVISSAIDDYHWYRLDDINAQWSHKPGHTPARNVDSSNATIADPRRADRGPYEQFTGFFHSYPARITIR
ncbi:MAG: hypothetical protein QM831_26915 [Kofleriaceae bacterium]